MCDVLKLVISVKRGKCIGLVNGNGGEQEIHIDDGKPIDTPLDDTYRSVVWLCVVGHQDL